MGFLDRRLSRRDGLSGALALALPKRVSSARAELTATIVGTAILDIRASPGFDCAAVGSAALGESLTVTGDAVDGFVPVAHGDTVGYAPALFLATDLDHVPFLVEGRPGCNRVALIFNVGIGDDPAIDILDTLQTEGVQATMFVMGWWASEHPAALTRMVADGHVVGSHGDQPIEPTLRADEEIDDDLHDSAAAIEHATGVPPARYYTAYAAASDDRVRAVVAGSGYLPVTWKVPADDYGPDATEEAVYERVMDNIYDGAIVELHLDGPASAVSTGLALPRIVADLRQQGYRFVTIPDLIRSCDG